MIHLPLGQRFPAVCQLPKQNSNYSNQAISKCGCSLPTVASRSYVEARLLKEFPTIKNQFISFPNKHEQACKSLANANDHAGHGKCQSNEATTLQTDVMPTPATLAATTTTTTVTQTSHNMSTKIDTHSHRTVVDDDDDVVVDVDVAFDDVHKVAFDNELNAHEQTFNLNVETEGVRERKEIEHQQAENFNDAFGRRHDHDQDNYNDCKDDDAMNADLAKNKRKICEQLKLETTAAAHNELNMTKEQQSICLASEQNQTIAEPTTASNRQQRQLPHSDARESSSEQVDGQQQPQISVCHHVKSNAPTIVIQTETGQTSPPSLSSSSLSSTPSSPCPSIEFLKCAASALLDEGASGLSIVDLEYIDLLTQLVQLIATPTTTGIFWSAPVVEQVANECADMTVSKVSDDSEATAAVVEIYSEQIEQPVELDDNNNNNNSSSNNQSVNMKYEVIRSTPRLPETLSSRLSSTAATSPAATVTTATVAPYTAALTSRIRDAIAPTTTSTSRPLLSELKRSSTSREDISIDVDSLLPERTRLRRQRRMRSQESVEEKPEDVIERLNKLKARISGALSEVKGVLKQYSTESEAEAAGEKWQGPSTSAPVVEEPVATEPVQFRFVKKVRRRSCFDEAEEEQEQAKEAAKLKAKEVGVNEATTKVTEGQIEVKKEAAAETTTKVIEQQQKQSEAVQPTKDNEVQEQPTKEQEKPTQNEELQSKSTEKTKAQAKIEFLAKVQNELKSKPKPKEPIAVKEQPHETSAATTATNKQPQPVEGVEATPQIATLPNESATQPESSDVSTTLPAKTTAPVVTKKKIIVKVRNPRRASIAAVEPSKIVAEPVQIDALTQRRPSDSEAIVKRKKKQKLTSIAANATATAIVSGSNLRATAIPQLQKATAIDEQLVAAKVISNEVTANCVAKPIAKIAEDDAKKATAAATTAPATTAASTANAATATTVQAAPKQLPIDDVANQATARDQSRRASLKLAELVGETVLVVPAAAATTATTQDITSTAIATVAAPTTATTAAPTAASTAALSTAISSSLSQSKEPINQSVIIPVTAAASEAEATPQQVVDVVDIEVAPAVVAGASAPQIAATLSEVSHDESSEHQQQQEQQQQQLVEATKDNAQEQADDSLAAMPELKVLSGPVQAVNIKTVEQPHDEADLVGAKKKCLHLKKLVRKSSIDKGKEKLTESAKLNNILKDKNKINDLTDRINKLTPPKKQIKAAAKEQAAAAATATAAEKQQENAEITNEAELEPDLEPEQQPEAAPTPKPKKPRQIKKKVIIKRQKRRLSIGDTFFIQQEPEEPKVPEIETIEKAIAYVTDDEDDVEPEPVAEPAKPLKSCLHVREYKIGDLVLYAERYRKTQVRWKRGRVLERITSISYKLDIEGKEVPAHISYIKKYTGRKVKFVGKEYLEIDYEQVVEEERRARSYSIWNMV